ncbi:hypothetical protein [Paracoccus yeei]|uniref:hypothetical protein n=1 Tax=Paracoccus yeei TaxID=147645 RepID=UPI003BF80949
MDHSGGADQLAAMALSGGVFKNPTFRDWTGTAPPNISISQGTVGSFVKVDGKYGNAVQLTTTANTAVGPYIYASSTADQLSGYVNPAKLLVSAEIEAVSGSMSGVIFQVGWKLADTTNTWAWVSKYIGGDLKVGGGIQFFQSIIERPESWNNRDIDAVQIRLFASATTTVGSTAAPNRIIVHRFDAQEIKSGSFIDEQRTVKATLDGLTEAAYFMRVKSGGANAGFEMVAANNVNGPKSSIRMDADEIIMNGTIYGDKIAAKAIGAREIAAESISARNLVVTASDNLVPDNQIQDDESWDYYSTAAIELSKDSSIISGTPQSSIGCFRFSGPKSSSYIRAHSKWFPVSSGKELWCSGEGWAQGVPAGSTGTATWNIQFVDGAGASVSIATFFNRSHNGTSYSGTQVQNTSIPVPTNAVKARVFCTLAASSNQTWIFASPKIWTKADGNLIVDGAITGNHIQANSIYANTAIVDGTIVSSKIAAQAIGAQQIASDAISARHLLVSDPTNLVPNADISDPQSWGIPSPWGYGVSGPAYKGSHATYLDVTNAETGLSPNVVSQQFVVDTGKEYYASIQARTNGAGQTVLLNCIVQLLRTDGTLITSYAVRAAAEGSVGNAVTTYEGSFVAPIEATRARIYWNVQKSGSNGRIFVGSPEVRPKANGKLIVDGTLKARHIEFETLTGGLMAPTGIITKTGQIDNLVVTGAKIADLTIGAVKIGKNALYVPYYWAPATTVSMNSTWNYQNPRLIMERNVPDFEGGGYVVAFNCFCRGWDAFGTIYLEIDGVQQTKQRFGVRASGGSDATYMIPVNTIASASGSGSTNIKVYAYSSHWNSDQSTSNPYTLENLRLTLSGSKR